MTDEQDTPAIDTRIARRLASGWGPAQRDGSRPHRCGFYIEEHAWDVAEKKHVCPPPEALEGGPGGLAASGIGTTPQREGIQSVTVTSLSTGEVFEGVGSFTFEPTGEEEDEEAPVSLNTEQSWSLDIVPTYEFVRFVGGPEGAIAFQQQQQLAALRGMR